MNLFDTHTPIFDLMPLDKSFIFFRILSLLRNINSEMNLDVRKHISECRLNTEKSTLKSYFLFLEFENIKVKRCASSFPVNKDLNDT